MRRHIAGDERRVARELDTLLAASGADEVPATTSAYDRAALLESFRRLARITPGVPT
ncbi:hypothetical protein [Streptomyces sp. MUM 178J]|uniref:hypothetical protein n=1 Tax=Streptomyces sp. MUM 178J TaxID=2791991 RepID=UPI001F048AC3|nr:hypothetical protein [Streptomyces sp. MUM 178J]WRQ79891.1 hypothetical protein I3F59_011325 [Streptomyces sp. MUM 178J]